MVVEGSTIVEKEVLNKRDSIEIKDANNIQFEVDKDTKLLLIDVPM